MNYVRVMTAMDAAAARISAACEICRQTAVYLCPTCHAPIACHTHERDYLCDTHGFVNPVRESDGLSINGSGRL